ncbi:DNA methylase [Chlorobaculum limnaeum]|uniref:site-specific DNA-methyltransferase (adenine-specific) n=2 Tax=Chlorobaculum limnaeum TaxID=274537 RepID=A0A1D8D5Y9_CHLLM|nr:DNA methylase [Chlorobaculum limnaeum]
MPELSFKGKEFVFNHHLAVPHRPLIPDASKSVGDARLDGNLVLHGDNLHALKSLLPMYAGKVDCIFIDPPYNTGNEGWCYNDNVNSPMMQQWLSENPVGIEDGLRHDKWCAMMWPRLRLLHELLGEAGSIWITLDDNEVHHARMMLDEIFGEDNFIANIVWQHSVQGKGYTNTFSVHHNHILVYGKSDFSFDGLERTEEDNVNYSNPDNDPKGSWRSGDVKNSLFRPNLRYELISPSGKAIQPPPNGWRWSRETMQKKIDAGEVIFVENETRILRKIYLSEQDKRAPETLWFADQVGSSRDATSILKMIFGGDSPFPTPKPVELLSRILALSTSPNSIILDSFAGSGTTAHAVLAANARDGGERRFILVECEEYADSLTAERVRRVIGGYSFKGTQREELLKKSLTFTDLKKADKLLHDIAGIENLETHRFSKIEKKVKDGELLVEGVTSVTERVEGLGGGFTYCTLGEAVDLERMLTGENLPGFDQLGALLFHMATSEALDPAAIIEREDGCGYLGESSAFHVWLIYKPDLGFLKSRDSALTLTKARELAASKPAGKRHLVFAPARFVSQKVLDEELVPVEFAPLPWALYRIERS